ncbi:uncharacterized protein LOC121751256 [Salvia splendens]|uniref:uncharacterized protein LOC121751256 n=1 Tax=Salvia splendens TaxID=180675 RepID=UPI001C27244D|nr:uncharacterized protein LOC121751256 [Salvia splendens]
MKKEFPKTDIKAHPHVYSKFSTWKKNYSSLCTMLDRSGVGFNLHDDYKIECDDEQWAQIVQKDSNARYMRNKSWPHWDSWKEIFGKNCVVCVRAKDAGEAVAKMKASQEHTNGYVEGDYHVSLDELFPDEVVAEHVILEQGEGSHTHGEKPAQKKTVKNGGKKRKSVDQLERVLDIMNRITGNTSERLETLSKRIGYEFEQSDKREEVYKLLGHISGLTLRQKFYISAKLVKESELLDLFRSMPEEDRPEFVVFMLESDGFI